jgi:hypothetical protein
MYVGSTPPSPWHYQCDDAIITLNPSTVCTLHNRLSVGMEEINVLINELNATFSYFRKGTIPSHNVWQLMKWLTMKCWNTSFSDNHTLQQSECMVIPGCIFSFMTWSMFAFPFWPERIVEYSVAYPRCRLHLLPVLHKLGKIFMYWVTYLTVDTHN